jgi:hypothetical protein
MLAAYRIAEEGINGGIRAVFDAISDAIREQRAEEYFQHAIHECVDTMDPDDVLELTSQFLDRYHEDAIGWPNFPPSPAALVPEYKQIIRVLADAISDVESAMGMMPSCEPAAAATRRQTGPLAGDAR